MFISPFWVFVYFFYFFFKILNQNITKVTKAVTMRMSIYYDTFKSVTFESVILERVEIESVRVDRHYVSGVTTLKMTSSNLQV